MEGKVAFEPEKIGGETVILAAQRDNLVALGYGERGVAL